jgi:hypothetical protein
MWLRRKEWLVDIYLGVDVDRVVSDVEELDDLRLGELFDYTFSGCLFLLKLAGVLRSQKKQ